MPLVLSISKDRGSTETALPGQTVPVFDHPHSRNIFSYS